MYHLASVLFGFIPILPCLSCPLGTTSIPVEARPEGGLVPIVQASDLSEILIWKGLTTPRKKPYKPARQTVETVYNGARKRLLTSRASYPTSFSGISLLEPHSFFLFFPWLSRSREPSATQHSSLVLLALLSIARIQTTLQSDYLQAIRNLFHSRSVGRLRLFFFYSNN